MPPVFLIEPGKFRQLRAGCHDYFLPRLEDTGVGIPLRSSG